MAFLVFLIISIMLFGFYEKNSKLKSIKLLYIGQFIIFWTLLIGGQYDVGTDYFSYIDLFSNGTDLDRLYYQKEYGFAYFIEICWAIGLEGQDILYVIAFISSILMLATLQNITKAKGWALFIMLFICFSTSFNNQMNGIRQYFVMYLFSYSISLLIKDNTKWSIFFLLLGISFHRSSLMLIPIYFLIIYLKKRMLSNFYLYGVIIAGIVISTLPILQVFSQNIASLEHYANYSDHNYLKEIPLKNKIIKYGFAIIFMIAISQLKKMNLSKFAITVFQIGVLFYSIRIASLNLSLTNRFGMYFELFTVFPLMYYLEYLRKKNLMFFVIISSVILTLYILKISIFAVQEYDYNSIYFQ